MVIMKRNGERVDFDIEKIKNAISKANNEMSNKEDKLTKSYITKISNEIESEIKELNRPIGVEEIQDKVEEKLMKSKKFNLAKAYITYRYQHNLDRNGNPLDSKILAIADGKDQETQEENSNKDPDIAPVQRDYFAGTISRDITNRILLPKDIVDAHNQGIIHFHDSDYFVSRIHNCCLINLEDMLQNGTVISKTKIEKPHWFTTACNIATQIIAQVASNQYGGSTISLAHLAPFVDDSRQRIRRKYIENDKEELSNLKGLKKWFTKKYFDSKTHNDQIEALVQRDVSKEIEKGIQILQYQVVTLMTTNGQTPFISFNMYLNEAKNEQEKDDLALIIEEVLKQRIQGIKNEAGQWVTPAFPKLLYVLQEDNITPDGKYYYLTELAAKCTAKRMVPDYISEKVMKKMKEGNCYPCMGSVDGKEVVTYKLNSTLYVESIERMWKRLSGFMNIQDQNNHNDKFIDLRDINATIYDNKLEKFVKCSCVTQNHTNKWIKVTLNDRVIVATDDHKFETENRGEVFGYELKKGDQILLGTPYTNCFSELKEIDPAYASTLFNETDDHIPSDVFNWNLDGKRAYLGKMIDQIGFIDRGGTCYIHSDHKELIIQAMKLAQSLSLSNCSFKYDFCINSTRYRYITSFNIDEKIAQFIEKEENKKNIICLEEEFIYVPLVETVLSVQENFDNGTDLSYDVTTESGHFEVSGIYSHNCRSFLNVWKDENRKYKFYGRFNKGVVTINLADVALSSEKDEAKFWEIFDERLELCHKALLLRYNRLKGTSCEVAPIMFKYGALARLNDGEKIDKLLDGGYSSISLGYAGLYECTKYMTGFSHTEDAGREFAISVMEHLNEKCAEWNEINNIGFSLYGTPIESTTYKFAKCLQKRFGIIEGITDKSYITNSYHVSPEEKIDAFTKLKKEAEFQKLSPGGAISYVEIPNMMNNIDAVLQVIKFIYENIMYAELNTRFDFCHKCGFEGEIKLVKNEEKNIYEWICPKCGNKDMKKMNVVRRTCGYIGTNSWNFGREDEFAKRVLHL